jgi:hypothetical protein
MANEAVATANFEDCVITQEEIAELKREFEATKNPVLVWRALILNGGLNTNFPQWIVEYLHAAAQDIICNNDADDREAEAVGKALGFGAAKKGEKGMFAAVEKLERYRALHREVVGALNKGNGTNLSSACAFVAATTDISFATVRRAYLYYQKISGHPPNESAG